MTTAIFSTSVECPVDNLRPRTGFDLYSVFLSSPAAIFAQKPSEIERVRP